mgnify:CR=1 FL=1
MQLKHLFVFLLVFFLSIAETDVYAQKSSSNYFKSSKVIQKKKITSVKYIVYNKTISSNYFLISLLPLIQQEIIIKKQIQDILKLQKQLYLVIASYNIQQNFLIKKITSGNLVSNLYIV